MGTLPRPCGCATRAHRHRLTPFLTPLEARLEPHPPPPRVPARRGACRGSGEQLSYDAKSITVLEGLEAVRKRPGMYIGSTGERGLHHLVYEIVDNAVDEALAGHADTIDVTLLGDGGVRVVDNGRGIPTDIHPTEGVSAVELVLTQLHAGGKFGGGGYKVSGGLHGVGSSVVNALSTRLVAEVRQKGSEFAMEFAHGVPLAPLQRVGPSDEAGTTITFWPNGEIFETTAFDFETLRSRFQQMAFLNKGLSISLVDERPDHADEDGTAPAVTFRYDGGLVDYVKHLNASKKTDVVNSEVIDFESEDKVRMISVEIAMQWTTAYSE